MGTQRKKNQNEIYNEYQNAVYNSEDIQATQDSYDLRRQENYIGLLDRELELEASKQNALKYTQNQMENQGLASQGYGSSVNAGIYNQYANAFQQAQSDYNFEQAGLDLEERQTIQAQQQRNMENLDKLIGSAGSKEDLEKIYEQYGFGTYDNEGNFVMGNKPEGMSQFDWTRYNVIYDNVTNTSNNSEPTTTADIDNVGNIQYQKDNGTITTLEAEGFNRDGELDQLQFKANNGQYKDGTVIELTHYTFWNRITGGITDKPVYLKYENGKFSVVTKEDYDKAENKDSIGNPYKKNKK